MGKETVIEFGDCKLFDGDVFGEKRKKRVSKDEDREIHDKHSNHADCQCIVVHPSGSCIVPDGIVLACKRKGTYGECTTYVV